jgi:hypothetical protein
MHGSVVRFGKRGSIVNAHLFVVAAAGFCVKLVACVCALITLTSKKNSLLKSSTILWGAAIVLFTIFVRLWKRSRYPHVSGWTPGNGVQV